MLAFRIIVAPTLLFLSVLLIPAQRPQPVPVDSPLHRSGDAVDTISNDVSKLLRSVEGLKKNWDEFFRAFSTNQGLQLTERQQKILLALEVLNRGEQRLGNLQKMKNDASERCVPLRLQLARINDDLLPKSVNNYVALRGTTDAEELRSLRRQTLQRERLEATTLLGQILRDLDVINDDIRQTEGFLRNIRSRIFPVIESELVDL